MARRTYTGVNSKARRVKRGSVGVADKARKIKRAYIGVGGVARPCWSGGEVAYYGQLTDVSVVRGSLAFGSSKLYAIFAGGSGVVATVDAYNAQFTHFTPSGLSVARARARSVAVGGYLLVAGGENESGAYYDTVDAYDENLTRTTATSLPVTTSFPSAAPVGGYAVVLGGSKETIHHTNAAAYDSSLTRSVINSAQTGHSNFPASYTEHHAVFAGGRNGYSSYTATVDAYDESLVRSSAGNMSTCGREWGASAFTGKTALFGGGYGSTGSGSGTRMATVDAYTDALTRLSAPDLPAAVVFNGGSRIGESGAFVGGSTGSGWSKNVSLYNDSLVRTDAASLPVSQEAMVAATVDEDSLMIYHCGYTRVDAYTVQ